MGRSRLHGSAPRFSNETHLHVWTVTIILSTFPFEDMTMDEVREFERATQEATNKKIGVFPPAISISGIALLPSSVRSAPSSAPSTPLSTDAPEFLSIPKDRPRKKSAPETLTLPDPEKKATLNLPGVYASEKPCRPKSE